MTLACSSQVVLIETFKLTATFLRSGFRPPLMDSQSVRASLKFIIPSVIYAINNNMYLAGLILVPPPIWVILCSSRTIITACLYKFILGRDVTNVQLLGTLLIVGSIVCAKLGTPAASEC